MYQKYTEHYGTEQLLVTLALGKVKEPLFDAGSITELKKAVIVELESRGLLLGRMDEDREDVPTPSFAPLNAGSWGPRARNGETC